MCELSIDIETYSSEDLAKTGVYRYAEAPDFTILLFAYAFDDEEIKIVDLASGEVLPEEVMAALVNPEIAKTAYNANFERTCLAAYLQTPMPPEQWRCTMIAAAELGLPQNLAGVAEALGLAEQKDKRGRALIDYFSKPCRATKTNGGRIRNMPQDAPEKWAVFKDYCIQDVAVERAIKEKLARFPLAEKEQQLWELDQQILDRGAGIDIGLTKSAIRFQATHKERCTEMMRRLTGLENANSTKQLKGWVEARIGKELGSIDKKTISTILEATEDEVLREVLLLRQETSKTSVTKYETMLRSVCRDGHARGFLQFYGANRTGRWAGRLIQVQNMPQNHMMDLDLARELVQEGDYETFGMLYPISRTLSELTRTALVPSPGCRFLVSDFSAIEARVLAYLADAGTRLDTFRQNGDIYCASASQMFRVPVVKHGVNGHLRQKGKIAELALGYGGGVVALVNMGALDMGILEEELQPLVDLWRRTNPAIQKYWDVVGKAARNAVRGTPSRLPHGITFQREAGILFIGLPSGRRIAYIKPAIGKDRFGRDSITYMGLGRTGKWERLETWGGKLTENIVQAVARDCLAESLFRLDAAGYRIVFHVHDEVILDVPQGESSAEEVAAIMGESIRWAPGLPLNADAYECDYYKKD